MKITETVLPARAELKLWLPKDGFSDDFLRAVAVACSGSSNVDEAYLVLMGDEGTLLIAFQLSEPSMNAASLNGIVAEEMEGLMPLLDATVQMDAICLNGRPGVRDSILSLTSPFYKKVYLQTSLRCQSLV